MDGNDGYEYIMDTLTIGNVRLYRTLDELADFLVKVYTDDEDVSEIAFWWKGLFADRYETNVNVPFYDAHKYMVRTKVEDYHESLNQCISKTREVQHRATGYVMETAQDVPKIDNLLSAVFTIDRLQKESVIVTFRYSVFTLSFDIPLWYLASKPEDATELLNRYGHTSTAIPMPHSPFGSLKTYILNEIIKGGDNR